MIPWFQFSTIYVGPLPIQVWGFFVASGIAVSLFLLYSLAKKQHQKPEMLIDLAFFTIIFGFLGARIFHIVLYQPAFYFAHPEEIFKIWHGGLSSYGGFVGAIVGFLWYARKKHLSRALVQKYADLFAYVSVIGWMIARVGCFMIHDHMGKPCDCFLAIQTPDGPRLEMSLLEIIALIPLAVYMYASKRKIKPDGFYLALVSVYYGITRFILDFWRATDIAGADARYAGLTPAQYLSLGLVVFGVGYYRRIVKSRAGA